MRGQLALYVDPSSHRRRRVGATLAALGFEVRKVSTVREAREVLQENLPRLVVSHFAGEEKSMLDFCIGSQTGWGETLIVVLGDKIPVRVEERLFDCGVCDVITGVHTRPRLLMKRLRARLGDLKSLELPDGVFQLNSTIVDLARREVCCHGMVRPLRGILFDLLKYMLDNPGRVISRRELQDSPIWADSICTPAEEGGKTFDVNISKLRRIIELDPSDPQIIQSVRGVGWKLARGCVKDRQVVTSKDLPFASNIGGSHR